MQNAGNETDLPETFEGSAKKKNHKLTPSTWITWFDRSTLNKAIITPRRVGGSGVKQLVLPVRPSVRLSVRRLSTQKSGYLAIYRVKRLLNTTVTLN